MEVDFDKEIDALLRKARHDGPVLVGDAKHLDADEIAAFAENALPEKLRGVYTMHFAECDRCRKILSNLLVMNSEAVPVAAAPPSAITIAERDLPWYRKLFLFPNLAYVMGGLVLIFGGFLAFTIVLQSGLGGGSPMVSQVADSEASRADYQRAAPEMSTNSTANSAANVALGEVPMMNANAAARPLEPGVSGPRTGDTGAVADGIVAGEAAPPPAPPATIMTQPAPKDALDDAVDKEKTEAKATAGAPIESAKNDLALKRADNNMPGSGGPMRSQSQYERQLENLNRQGPSAPKKAATASRDEEDASSGTRAVGGRKFERKQGVWYDVTYQGRPTINVRRGTPEFERLDGGLRSIANQLSGTIVVVWGAKAYRIQ